MSEHPKKYDPTQDVADEIMVGGHDGDAVAVTGEREELNVTLGDALAERDMVRLAEPELDLDRLAEELALGVLVAERVRVALLESVAERVRDALFVGDALPVREVDAITDGDTGLRVKLGVALAERDRERLAEPDVDPDELAGKLALDVGVAWRDRVALAESVAERDSVAKLERDTLPDRGTDALALAVRLAETRDVDADALALTLAVRLPDARDTDRDDEMVGDALTLAVRLPDARDADRDGENVTERLTLGERLPDARDADRDGENATERLTLGERLPDARDADRENVTEGLTLAERDADKDGDCAHALASSSAARIQRRAIAALQAGEAVGRRLTTARPQGL